MINFAFFGSSRFSIHVLDMLKAQGLLPSIIVTTPDKPAGRGLVLSPTPVKIWAKENGIISLDPAKLDDAFIEKMANEMKRISCDLFVVASYGKIIPEKVLGLAPKKTLNVHPSLLPKYRGASPIQSAMIDDARDTGVTIIRLDREMDHGPIVAAEKVRFDEWPTYEIVEEKLGAVGGALLAKIMPDWVKGNMKEIDQDHSLATFTKKITKEDGLLDLKDVSPDAPTDLAYLAFRKIQAYRQWPGAYFFFERKMPTRDAATQDIAPHDNKKIRVKITAASWRDKKLMIEKVIPEGKKEMLYSDFLKG